jgi:hypothetical protein
LAHESLVIENDIARVMLGEKCTKTVPVDDLVQQILHNTDWGPVYPEIIPHPVRWIQHRGPFTCVVAELSPGPRTVQWIADDSPQDFGEGVKYVERRLSFPFIVVGLLFEGPRLVDARLYYRNQPMCGRPELLPLSLPNLLNVSDIPDSDRRTWFCIQYVDVSKVGWYEKVMNVGEHLFFSGFNRSSEHHEGHSYFRDNQENPVDPRVATVEEWEASTERDGYFTLEIEWRPAGKTVADLTRELLDAARAPGRMASAKDLIGLAARCRTIMAEVAG